MNDPRPKPQYGEYAPPGWVSPVQPPETHEGKAQSDPGHDRAASARRVSRSTRAASRSNGSDPAVRPRRNWDLFLTVALLAVGAFNVVTGFVGFSNLPQTLTELYKTQGIGAYTEIETGQTIGVAVAVSQAVILLVTVWISYRALKRNRLAFYWPLIGFAVAMIVTLVLLTVAMFVDPAFMEYVNRQAG